MEGEILVMAKNLMVQYTLYVTPPPNPLALMSKVHPVWNGAQDEIADAGNIELLRKSIQIVSSPSQSARGLD